MGNMITNFWRRYSPFVNRSEDEGIIISNDDFGVSIRQFERIYKACLDRRKTKEQYILNLRYPDKSSDDYLEYLENSTRGNKDYLSWPGNDLTERYLYEHLLETVGTEIDIRKRQQLFIIQDTIAKTTELPVRMIWSGSLAEGIDLPGSDMDMMYVNNDIDVIEDIRNIKHPEQRITLLMETDTDHPGYSRLRLISHEDGENNCITHEYFERSSQGIYLSEDKFFSSLNMTITQQQLVQHGPCLSDLSQNFDLAFCYRSNCLPHNVIPWLSRDRHQWPPNFVIQKIKKYGCMLVPIGPRDVSSGNLLWRLSFSVAEKQLVHSFNFTQLLCYCLLKLTLKHIVNINKHTEGLLCSYFLKTALFWVSEEVDIETFQLAKLFVCFSNCLDKLKLWVKKCYCPNYFIPEHNMFLGKVNSDNNTILLNVLDDITGAGVDGLIQKICPHINVTFPILRTNTKYSSIMLDFLFYKICGVCFMTDISHCLKGLIFTESLIKSKSSTFLIDVCKYYHASISKHAVQLLPSPSITRETYYIHKRYYRYLQDGIKTDAVSGWLLYASFYYITGQYYVTIRLADYVLSKCSPSMFVLGCVNYSEESKLNYRNNVCSTIDRTNFRKVRVLELSRSSLEFLRIHIWLIPLREYI